MKNKIKSCLAIMCMLIAVSLCFVGCDFSTGGSGGGSSSGGTTTSQTVESIGLSGSIKTDYKLGENLDLNNAKLTVLYSDETTKTVNILESMVTGFSTENCGNFTMTITYKEKSITKNYSVTLDADNLKASYESSSTDVMRKVYAGTNTLVDESSERLLSEQDTVMRLEIDGGNLTWVVIVSGNTSTTEATFTVSGDKIICKLIKVDGSTENVPAEGDYSMTATFTDTQIILRTNGLIGVQDKKFDVIFTLTKTN